MTSPDTAGSTRRRLLRTTVNVSVGAGLVWGVGAEYASSGDTVEVEYAVVRSPPDGGSLAARTKRVPADWHASLLTVFDAQRRLREAGLSSVVGAFVVPGSFDEPAASLAVDVTAEEAGARAATVVGDIGLDVSVLDALPEKPDDAAFPGEPYQVAEVEGGEVPGGVLCRAGEISGTLASAAFDTRRGRRCFLTSNHVYGAAGTKVTEHRGEPLAVVVDDAELTVGRVERGHPEADVVSVGPAEGYTPVPEIPRAEPPTVVGQFTRMGLADLMARNVDLRKVGAYSGETSGKIHGVDGFTCYLGRVCKDGQLKWGDKLSMTDGDSGSINFAPDPEHPDEYVIAGGINNAYSWWPGADFTWGTAAFHLLEAYGIHF